MNKKFFLSLKDGIIKILSFLFDFISPKKCYFCRKEGVFLCDKCLKNNSNFESCCYTCKLPSANFDLHKKCKNKNFYLDKVIIGNHYKNPKIKKIIKDFKYKSRIGITKDIGIYLADLLVKNIDFKNKKDYLIIPSSMYFFKKIKRGYNQAELIAKEISKITNIKYCNKTLKKIKNTKPQAGLTKLQREFNLKGVFKLNKTLILKNIILVDDVISTGSTLNTQAKILKQNGAKQVFAITIASD